MSGFEHYQRELSAIDREIVHQGLACGVDLADALALDKLSRDHRCDRSREALYGLLQLRLKIETEMLELGLKPPPLCPHPPEAPSGDAADS